MKQAKRSTDDTQDQGGFAALVGRVFARCSATPW